MNATETQTARFNIAQYLPARAKESPGRQAVICEHSQDGRGRIALTFSELHEESDACARGLARLGLAAGERTLLMLRPGLDFVTLTFALFKLGAVPVLIDPGMGLKNLLGCVKQSQPQAFIAVSKAHAIRTLSARESFSSVRLNITAGRRWFWGGARLNDIRQQANGSAAGFEMAATTRESAAAILFTTGSTGAPKGVLYQHGMFDAQVRMIREQYGIEPGEVDLPAFPLFALFSVALGTTCVIPDMDPTRPAQCDPAKIVRAIQKHNVTYTFGSPSIWARVGPYCIEKGIQLPSLKRILMAGAPVRGTVLEPFKKILPNGDTFIPYGATEALPVCSIRGSEVLAETWELTGQGNGHCVGRPLPGVSVRIVDPDLSEGFPGRAFVHGEIGEIAVSGENVTQEYHALPEATAAAKIRDPHSGALWHRMGDMGYFDEKKRLWFCGRKAHRVITRDRVLYSVCVEAVYETFFNQSIRAEMIKAGPDFSAGTEICRAALVGTGNANATPVIVFETSFWIKGKGSRGAQALQNAEQAIEKWRKSNQDGFGIEKILYYPDLFPVDIRHNAKINREKLAEWARRQA